MERRFFLIGTISAFLAVGAGAFAAHLLKDRLPPDLFDIFLVGARYHMYHSLALLATSWAAGRWPGPWAARAGWSFISGLVLFSGSLYLLSLTGQRWLGVVTPLGGIGFLFGWGALFLSAWRSR